jgi:microsomal dipeptidase-like Zn-dependent dipeptidase
MPAFHFSIDLHCHPNYKPFARAFVRHEQPPTGQSAHPSHPSSLWHYAPPGIAGRALNHKLGLTKFSQANLTAALYGGVMVMVVGLGATEKYFFRPKGSATLIADLVIDFAAGFRMPRINRLQAIQDYWPDFLAETEFLWEQQNHPVKIDGHWYTYRWAQGFADLLEARQSNEMEGAGSRASHPMIICLIPSVEGLHILGTGTEQPVDEALVLQRTLALKQMPQAPWFVTFSHHFYNHLCGHARSLRNPIARLVNQEEGLGTGITPLGRQVLELLADEQLGRRIFIDIKHMSAAGRREWLQWLKDQTAQQMPVIISHGVANGLPHHGATESRYPELGNRFIQPLETPVGGAASALDHNEINFYDDEILAMAASDGIMGLQLDERRIANDQTLQSTPNPVWRHKAMHYRSALLWQQIQYIGELLDDHGLYAWGHLAIGSDYDGLVDPLNSFWTVEQYHELAAYLERHAYNYFTQQGHRLRNSFNRIGANLLIRNIFCDNAWRFFQRWF